MNLLFIVFLTVYRVHSDSRTLRFCTTGVSAPGSGLPEFSTIGYMDDQQIELYTSDIGRRVPVAPWMKKEKRDYWVGRTQSNKVNEALFRNEVELWKKRHNQTGGFHFVQVIHSCELRDDGSAVGYERYSYDGEEYMYYDIAAGRFVPIMADAQTVTQRWNMQNTGIVRRTKIYLESRCMERLQRFIEYGREDLERRVRPGVKVTGEESGEITKLHCLVYGFHPRAVDVKWVKNGVDDVPTYQTTHVLPHPDGTYQIRVTAEVFTKDGDSYSCYVDHPSLEEPLLVEWELKQDSALTKILLPVIIGAILIIVLVLVFVYIRCKKKKDNSHKASVCGLCWASFQWGNHGNEGGLRRDEGGVTAMISV